MRSKLFKVGKSECGNVRNCDNLSSLAWVMAQHNVFLVWNFIFYIYFLHLFIFVSITSLFDITNNTWAFDVLIDAMTTQLTTNLQSKNFRIKIGPKISSHPISSHLNVFLAFKYPFSLKYTTLSPILGPKQDIGTYDNL